MLNILEISVEATAVITNGKVNAEKLGQKSKFLYSKTLQNAKRKNTNAKQYKMNKNSFDI